MYLNVVCYLVLKRSMVLLFCALSLARATSSSLWHRRANQLNKQVTTILTLQSVAQTDKPTQQTSNNDLNSQQQTNQLSKQVTMTLTVSNRQTSNNDLNSQQQTNQLSKPVTMTLTVRVSNTDKPVTMTLTVSNRQINSANK